MSRPGSTPEQEKHALSLLAPSVEFPVTICVVCYGEQSQLAEQFLESLYQHTDPALFELRAGLNEAEPRTHQLFAEAADRYGNIDLYIEADNIFKEPMTRRLFWEKPLTKKWVIWFDDDSYPTRPDWLQRLAIQIEACPQAAQWGQLHGVDVGDDIMEFVESAEWSRNLPLQLKDGPLSTAPYTITFSVGGFWAMQSEVLRALQWPDKRILQAAGDFLLGEALRQNDYKIGWFDYGLVINGTPRRNAQGIGFHSLRRLEAPSP